MHKKNTKPRLEESTDKLDLLRMQPEVALVSSMLKSKTLTAFVIIGVLGFATFFYFLYNMAGA